MAKSESNPDREELLADVAEMYYLEGKTQAEISKKIGKTRSAVSRMLTEAHQKNIVEIKIRHPLRFNPGLEKALIERFALRNAYVINWQSDSRYTSLRHRLGQAAAKFLPEYIKNDQTIGIAWGTTVHQVVEAFPELEYENLRIVQLIGVLGSARHSYSGQTLVEQFALKIGGQGIYLYSPFIVDNPDTARVLRDDQSIREVITAAQQCNLAILGVGSTDPEFCSLFQGGHISEHDLWTLKNAGAVGDVSGHYFDLEGKLVDVEYHQRLVGIKADDLLGIPVRLAVAGGEAKAPAIFGALCGGFINALVTNSRTAEKILELSEQHCN